jgi:hypothetical protein
MSDVMIAEECDAWTDDVQAVDRFAGVTVDGARMVLVSFGVAMPEEDNSDILRSPEVAQEVLDMLDEPTSR